MSQSIERESSFTQPFPSYSGNLLSTMGIAKGVGAEGLALMASNLSVNFMGVARILARGALHYIIEHNDAFWRPHISDLPNEK